MNRTAQRLGAWGGIVSIVVLAIGFWWIAGFLPPPRPSLDPAQVADYFDRNRQRIRVGMLISMWGSTLLMPWAAAVHLQLKRVEGRFPVLANTQYGMGVLLVAEFVFLILFWQTTAFRSDRDPKIVQAFNDLAWIPFVALTSTIVFQALMMSLVMLLDRSAEPLFPRWAGYFNLWATICLTPGSLVPFFHDGPLAWDGLIALYLPLVAFASWVIVNSALLLKAIDTRRDGTGSPGALADDPAFRDLVAEVAALRAERGRASEGVA